MIRCICDGSRRDNDSARRDHVRSLQTINRWASSGERRDATRRNRRVRCPGGAIAIDPRGAGGEGTDNDCLPGGGRFGDGRTIHAPIGPARLSGGKPSDGRRGVEIDPCVPLAYTVSSTQTIRAHYHGPRATETACVA
jgi:hypothetical protein